MKRLVCLVSVLLAFAGGAAEKLWKGGVIDWPADGWTNADYWDGGLPGSDDTAMFSVAVTARVTKANCADVNKIKQISAKWMYDFRLELDSSGGDFDFDCMLGGTARVVKKGTGTVQLTSNRKEKKTYNESWMDLSCNRLIVEQGTLQTPTVATRYCLPIIEIAAGATFAYASQESALIGGLVGAGTFANTSGAVRNVWIGASGSAVINEFSGKTENFGFTVYNTQYFTGIENTAGDGMGPSGNTGDSTYGVLGFLKLGMNDRTASSVGAGTYVYPRTGGHLRYLGSGETSNKEILYQTDSNVLPPALDGGPNGGLVLTGTVHPLSQSAANRMGEFLLTGENTNACVIAGYYDTKRTAADDTEVTIYTTKKGSGVWRFADFASRYGTGGYGVLEGTLQFESIAETNVNCSLGRATRLAECYRGAWDPAKAVTYAYRLGDADSTNAVFEFVGSLANACSTRPIAMGGEAHLRANGLSGAPLDFAGVTVLASGPETKTLILDGTNTDENVLGNVSDVGGRLTVVKDGPGTWMLDRNQTFHGDLKVMGGTLTVRKNAVQNWFKLTIKGVSDTSKGRLFLPEFALYDEDGMCVTKDLSFVPGRIETIGGIDYTSSHVPQNLKSGEFTYGDTSITRYRHRTDEYSLDKIFDGTMSCGHMARASNPLVPTGVAGSEFVLVMRVDSAKSVTAFDLVQYSGDVYPTSIEIHASQNGSTWEQVYSNAAMENRGGNWYSDRKSITTAEPRLLAEGATIKMDVSLEDDGYSVLSNVTSVSVAPGAALNTAGLYVPEISHLTIDGSTGAGTISGFKLGGDVTVDVVNAPKHGGVLKPVGFAGLSGFGDVTNWTYTINGEAPKNRTVKLTQDSLEIRPGGLSIILK